MKSRCGALLLSAMLAAAAGALPASAQLVAKTLVYQGATRTWFQHVPESYNGTQHLPLVIALHGFNSSGDQFGPVSEWIPKADAAGFMVVFPNGGNPVDKSWGWHAFAFHGEAPDDAGFLLTLIDELKKDYPIDPARIYMTGFSNGGGMASTFALLHADVLAGLVPVSGGWRENVGTPALPIEPPAAIPVWVWRGTAEKLDASPADLAKMDLLQTQFWAAWDGAKDAPQIYNQPPYTTSIYRGGRAEVRYTSILGAQHDYQPGTAAKTWDGFFAVFSRSGKSIVYHRPK
jgi:poly(3-hydroxybutyrate) depolymerase